MSEAARYFVYVLHNPAGILYTGIAKDVELRLHQHNAGRGARFTRGRGPWTVCHREGPLDHGDALRREAAIKIDRMFKAVLRERIAAVAALARKRLARTGVAKTKPARPRTNGASAPKGSAKKERTGSPRSAGISADRVQPAGTSSKRSAR